MLRHQESPSDCTPDLIASIHALYAKIPQAIILSTIRPFMYLTGVKVGFRGDAYALTCVSLLCVLACCLHPEYTGALLFSGVFMGCVLSQGRSSVTCEYEVTIIDRA